MAKKWMSSGYLKSAPTGRIDREKGIIEGVSVCTVGEAKGHGVNLDQEFIDRVVDFGSSKRQGLKARFGHPNMCSTALGTFIGRFKNFRTVGDQAKADLFLSNEAKETPHGNLYDYVLGMAENEPDMFGTSIVFTPGKAYRRDVETGEKVYESFEAADRELTDEVYVECEELHACDTVDEPAANDGLFSRFSQETVAGQITEFLDLNPQVWDAVQSNPSILEALGRYGDKVDEFFTSYRTYREQTSGGLEMTDERTSAELLEEADVTDADATETPEVQGEELSEEAAESVEAQDEESTDAEEEEVEAEEVETEEPAAVEEEEIDEQPQLSRKEFARIADKFGDAIAARVMREGGDYSTALELAFEEAEKEKQELAEQLKQRGGANPVKVVEAKRPDKLFNTNK